MKIGEIYDKNWKVNDKLTKRWIDMEFIPTIEQECTISVLRDDNEILFDCSNKIWITKLSKSKRVTVDSVLISKHVKSKDYVLQVAGRMQSGTLTVRSVLNTPNQK